MAIRLVNAAKVSAVKKSTMKNCPNGTRANSCGIQMNVRPSLRTWKIVVCTRSGVSG